MERSSALPATKQISCTSHAWQRSSSAALVPFPLSVCSHDYGGRRRERGAVQAFDCVDFGLPTTYPSGREGIRDIFANALDFCLSLSAEALVVECGGDLLGANVPEFLACLKARRSDLKIILAAADALGALGAKHALAEIGLAIDVVTGPCTDTPSMCERTQALCGIPAINLLRGPDQLTQSNLSGAAALNEGTT